MATASTLTPVTDLDQKLQDLQLAYQNGDYTELEYRIVALATQYTLARPEGCIDPITQQVVPDHEYDDLVDRLRIEQPDSEVLSDVDPAQAPIDPDAKIVKHDPPMGSLAKANGTEVVKAERLANWMADCLDDIGYMNKDSTVVALDKAYTDPFDVFKNTLLRRGYNYVPQAFAEWFCLLYKRDGIACRIYYENGVLVKAGMRSKTGTEGEDITENLKYMANIPQTLPEGFTGAVQGEIYCKRSVLEAKNPELLAAGKIKEPFANERSYAGGAIRQFKDPSVTGERAIDFVFHGAVAVKTKHAWKTELDRALWFAKAGFEVVRISKFQFETLADLEDLMKTLDYTVDGAVVKVSNLRDQEERGTQSGKYPLGALAWKFRDEIGESTVTSIGADPGRTGGLTPVVNFNTIRLAGTNVSYATAHNLAFLARNQIKVGSKVGVKKSGMIIPCLEYVLGPDGKPVYIQEVEKQYIGKGSKKKLKLKDVEPYVYAKTCPSCGHDTEIEEGGSGNFELICPNNFCPAQIARTFKHFLTVMGVKGIGLSTLKLLVANGLKSPAQFYRYYVSDLEAAGLSKREALLAIAAIHGINNPSQYEDGVLDAKILDARAAKKKAPIWQLFASFGIYGAGKTAGKALQQHYHTLENMRAASAADMVKVEGIGPKTAQVVWEFFDAHGDVIDDLLNFVEVEGMKTGKLTGMTFCLTGSFEPNKDYWKKKIEDEGGITKDSAGKGLTYLVEGEEAGSKVDKVKAMNAKSKDGHQIQIINVQKLQDLIES